MNPGRGLGDLGFGERGLAPHTSSYIAVSTVQTLTPLLLSSALPTP